MNTPFLMNRSLYTGHAKSLLHFVTKLCILLLFSFAAISVSAQIYTVNSTNDVDDGKCNANHCSLREAMNEVNLTTGHIEFDIPGAGPFVISPNFDLPRLYNNNITIDATTQTNWSPGLLVVHGAALTNCLHINGSDVEIYGLRIEKCFNAGILLDTINNEQKNITIGSVGKENILVNNKFGILATTDLFFDVTIQSNLIGTDLNNTPNLGNEFGIMITGSQVVNVKIGGSTVMGDGNRIVGSFGDGLTISSGTEVYGNVIGDFSPNQKSGIVILGFSNQIGGGTVELQNQIINNGEYGVRFNGNLSVSNTVSYNSIYCNGFGAYLANTNVNPPVITSNANGLLKGTSGANELIEIYNNESLCQDCQPEFFIGSTVADGGGDWSYNVGYNITTAITASATDANGNTSSFSSCFKSDDCIDAFLVLLDDVPCTTASTIFNTEFASVSNNPLNDCQAFAPNGAVDIWVKAEVPSTGAVMVKLNQSLSAINPMVEVYTGDCNSLQYEKCDSLFAFPFQFPVAELTPGDFVYFRVFDQYNANQGYVALNIVEIPADTSQWRICTDGQEYRAANDFVVQYENGATDGEVQAVTADLLALGVDLVGQCECGTRPLQLYRGSTPVEAETGGLIAKNRAEVDTVNYNFIIEDQLCITEEKLTTIVYYPGSPGQPGGYSPLVEFVNTYADCTPEGLIDPLGPAYNPVVTTPSVNLAIIDTGFDESNAVITKAIWDNPELSDTDNCYLNDDSGYDFLNDDGNPNDIVGHGTAVAGIVAGRFNSNVDLNMMNLKFSDTERSTLFPAICALYYAIDNGAQVMNLSWGFMTTESIPDILQDVLDYAYERDVLIVTSAGNSNDNIDEEKKFPANYDRPNIITVGAYVQFSGSNPERASYSNFGKDNVDLFANGQVETVGLGNTIEVLSGTSLSTPLVSRTASEIRAKYPALSAQDVRNCILNTVDVYANLDPYCLSDGVLNHDAAIICAYNKTLEFCGDLSVSYDDLHSIDTLIVKEISIASAGIVSSLRDVIYKAGDEIILEPNFDVELGATFLATIEDCSASVPTP